MKKEDYNAFDELDELEEDDIVSFDSDDELEEEDIVSFDSDDENEQDEEEDLLNELPDEDSEEVRVDEDPESFDNDRESALKNTMFEGDYISAGLPEDTGEQSEEQEFEEHENQLAAEAEKKTKKQIREEEKAQPRELFVLSDKRKYRLLKYFRDNGLKVSKIYYDFDSINNDLLMQIEECTVVVLDSGTGRLTGLTARKSLIQLLGLAGSDIKMVMIYTDSAVIREAEDALLDLKHIKFEKYKSLPDSVVKVLSLGENYKYSMEPDEEEKKADKEGLQARGISFMDTYKARYDITQKLGNAGIPSIKLNDVTEHLDDEKTQLPAFAVKY